MPRRRAALALAAGACAFVVLACIETKDEPDEPYAITAALPFDAPESSEYVLVDDDGDQIGAGTISVLRDGDSLTLVQSFADEDGNSDESVLAVDAGTLRPLRGRRDIIDADDGRRALVESEYAMLNDDGDYGVRIRQTRFDPIDDDDPDVRCSPLKTPLSAFDNDASLFLWRTLTFEAGFEVQYANVITNRRAKDIVTVRVRRREEVETPAGRFDAWLVTVTADEQTQEAWLAATPEHRLLKYDNDSAVFLYRGEGPLVEPEDPAGVPPDCRS